MKIAEYKELRIFDEVVYRGEEYKIVDFKRVEHLAQLKNGKYHNGRWLRCSEFERLEPSKRKKRTISQPKEKPMIKPKVDYQRQSKKGPESIRCKAMNLRKGELLSFRSIRECAKYLGTTFYLADKAIRKKSTINGYVIYREKEMGIEEYKEAIAKCRGDMMTAMQNGPMQKVVFFQKELALLEKKLKELEDDQEKYNKMKSEDKEFVKMMDKTLSLLLNEADLAIYHLDIYFTAVKSFGLVDKAKDWTEAKNNLRKALREFAFFPRLILPPEIKVKNEEMLCETIGKIRDGYYTEKEQVYYDKYEELSGDY